MEPIDLTERQTERVESIRAELSDAAGAYATVTTADVMEYLLDLAQGVDDPNPQENSWPASPSEDRRPYPRDALRDRLADRNRKHGDEGDHEEMDLYTIAAAYDVTGRSSMTKAELVDAILDTAERRYRNPFAPVDIEFPADGGADGGPEEDAMGEPSQSDGEGDTGQPEEPEADTDEDDGAKEVDDETEDADDDETEDADDDTDAGESDETAAETETDGNADTDEKTGETEGETADTEAASDDAEGENDDADESTGDAADNAQLNTMLSLLETHDDKWQETDGDARYEVELPDGSVRTARTKDDVRAVLFKNY